MPHLLQKALAAAEGNKTIAAKLLGVSGPGNTFADRQSDGGKNTIRALAVRLTMPADKWLIDDVYLPDEEVRALPG